MATPEAQPKHLHIAMISYYLPSGSKIGVGYQVHELATELVRRGHTVDVFSNCAPVPGARYGHQHVRLGGSLRTFRFAIRLRAADLSSYDVLHAHGDDYWLWRRRVPVHVRTLHGSCFDEALTVRGGREKLRMLTLGLSEMLASVIADTTVAVSPGTLRWTPWVRHVIPNGVDIDRFQARGPRAKRPTVLFVGTWGGRKRGHLLAETFQRDVLPAVPDAELRMVTQDVPDDADDVIARLERLDDEALAEEYRRAWVFCLPSSYEGFGIPYAEAMASGAAVVATRNVGARYVTDEGRAGLCIATEQLGPAIVALLTDPAARAVLAEKGLARAQDFALGSVVDRYEKLYRSPTSSPRPRRRSPLSAAASNSSKRHRASRSVDNDRANSTPPAP